MQVIHEGAASPLALLGLVRLVHCLAQAHFEQHQWHGKSVTIVIDSGTGVTATGEGAACSVANDCSEATISWLAWHS